MEKKEVVAESCKPHGGVQLTLNKASDPIYLCITQHSKEHIE